MSARNAEECGIVASAPSASLSVGDKVSMTLQARVQLREQRPASCRECLPGWASKMLFKAATINTGPCAAMLGEAAYVCPSAYPFIGTKDRLSSYIMADSPGQSGWDK